MKLELNTTNVLSRHLSAYGKLKAHGVKIPIISHCGGTRSSKTVSINQRFLIKSWENNIDNKPESITISRAKMTWLRATVLKDFEWLITEYGIPIYPEFNPRRGEQIYDVFNSEWAFIGLDETHKLLGRKQDRIWVNEVMDCRYEDFINMEARTSKEIVIDYNPLAMDSWVYKLDARPECEVIHSTQLDNPFLPLGIRQRILAFEPTDENIAKGTADKYYWDVYGLGKKAVQEGRIFKNVTYEKDWPECKWKIYGLDFGYTNDPTTLVRIGLSQGKLYAKELIYETGLTNVPGKDRDDRNNIHTRLEELEIDKRHDIIIADSAEPKAIAELQKWGWNIKGAEKGPDSIRSGIEAMQRYPIVIMEDSMNAKKEIENYKWAQDKDGKLLNKPIDAFNHFIDAFRYGATRRIKIKKKTFRVSM